MANGIRTIRFDLRKSDGTILDNAIVFNSSGNVGIGTTAPGGHGSGAPGPFFEMYSASGGPEMYFGQPSTSADGVMAVYGGYNSARNARLGWMTVQNDGSNAVSPNGYLSFWTNNAGSLTEKVRIDKSGNVGIGTTGPDVKLVVQGTGGTQFRLKTDGTHGAKPVISFDSGLAGTNYADKAQILGGYDSATSGSGGYLTFRTKDTSEVIQDRLIINSSGSIYTTNWTGASFGSTWGNYGGGYQNVQYKKVGDLVFLRGLATTASAWSSYPTICTLPAGYRPAAKLIFHQTGNYSTSCSVRVDIDTSGNVTYTWSSGTAASGWISLDGIVFSVDS